MSCLFASVTNLVTVCYNSNYPENSQENLILFQIFDRGLDMFFKLY